MNRLALFAASALACAVVGNQAGADDPPKKLTAEERKQLAAKVEGLNAAALRAYQAGKVDEAGKAAAEGLRIDRQLYPKNEYPNGHEDLAGSLNNLAQLYQAQAKYGDAEPLLRDALEMRKRLFKGDHPGVVESLGNLAGLYEVQGKYADAEPLFRDALAMSRRLNKGDHPDVAISLNNLASLLRSQGSYSEAEPLFRDALAMFKRLSPGDDPTVAVGLNNLAELYGAQGRIADAEPLYRDALAMRKRLHKGDHRDVAESLNNLAFLYQSQGKYAEAEPFYRDALALFKRLSKGDHPDVATALSNLAALYEDQRSYDAAEPLCRDALAMRKRLFPGDHPDVAESLNNLAALCEAQKKYADAQPLHLGALAMRKRLFPGDHPSVAESLNNLAALDSAQGKYDEAERRGRDALAMRKRLFPGDHPDVAGCSIMLAFVCQAQGKYAAAETLYRDALATDRRLVASYAGQKSEGEALTLVASLPLRRDGFLSNARAGQADPRAVYEEVWASKGATARVYEQRRQAARAAATDPRAPRILEDLTTARRRRAELLLAPTLDDSATRAKRENDLKGLDKRIAELDRDLRPLLPELGRAETLAKSTPGEIQKALPADALLVDFLAYTFTEYDPKKPGRAGETHTPCYLAFVLSKDKITWHDLGPAKPIDDAVARWREAITGPSGLVADEVPRRVRDLVWAKVRAEFPAGTKVVYVCPDLGLTRVPWAALPGDKPGTLVLEDFAVGTIPHGPFLLDKLRPPDPIKNPPVGTLVVGGVKYDVGPAVAPPSSGAVALRREPLVKPGTKLGWGALDFSVAEATGVVGAAGRKRLPVIRLGGDAATTAAVLESLPKVRFAHFATHGFFADPSFRGLFQLDEKDYEKSLRGERIGRAANYPLVMTGLVFAGANQPETPGRGIVTGEHLIDRDLSGLELVVLSACETGLGDVAGGEGTFGLQRAFHLAGTRDVVASLWKVPDQSTAALMALFYRHLWEKNLPPVEALRQAQLEVYRNPGSIPALAAGFRGEFKVVPGTPGAVEVKPDAGGKTHPLHWAAFTLSGPGR